MWCNLDPHNVTNFIVAPTITNTAGTRTKKIPRGKWKFTMRGAGGGGGKTAASGWGTPGNGGRGAVGSTNSCVVTIGSERTLTYSVGSKGLTGGGNAGAAGITPGDTGCNGGAGGGGGQPSYIKIDSYCIAQGGAGGGGGGGGNAGGRYTCGSGGGGGGGRYTMNSDGSITNYAGKKGADGGGRWGNGGAGVAGYDSSGGTSGAGGTTYYGVAGAGASGWGASGGGGGGGKGNDDSGWKRPGGGGGGGAGGSSSAGGGQGGQAPGTAYNSHGGNASNYNQWSYVVSYYNGAMTDHGRGGHKDANGFDGWVYFFKYEQVTGSESSGLISESVSTTIDNGKITDSITERHDYRQIGERANANRGQSYPVESGNEDNGLLSDSSITKTDNSTLSTIMYVSNHGTI